MSQNQCAYCGRSLEVNAKFCDGCGQPVGVRRPEPARTQTPLPELWRRFSGLILFVAVMAFAIYLLGQQTIQAAVTTTFVDDHFHEMLLTDLRLNPMSWYAINAHLMRDIYGYTSLPFVTVFPLIFYIWLLVPNLSDIKWLYFAFALAGTAASYFAIYAATKQSLVAVLSAAWMTYFLEGVSGRQYYLMLEWWAICVF